ncbi:MAG TPA: PH domain-containing protein [Verrucomicrobiae bacterium]|nr:PH domain-containing protein [Verrucomicrobiae bacterium]
MAHIYGAPWGVKLKVATVAGSVIVMAVTFFTCWQAGRSGAPAPVVWLCALLPLIVVGSALFAIRGYTVDSNGVFVHRLLWTNQLPWAGLREVGADPGAMCGGIRTCGNGGLFSFSGRYWNRRLGHYRALVTDPSRAVVLKYDTRTVVLSPDDPAAFVEDVRHRIRKG